MLQVLKCSNLRHLRSRQRGASMVEFVIVTPLLMFIGLGIMQFGLIYHAKSMLNYATFEAARAGAVNNGQIEVMRKELGYRLAPVYGGDGTLRTGVMAVTRATVAVNDISATKIEILNPLPASFDAHGKSKSVVDRHGNAQQVVAIENSHMRLKPREVGADGLDVQDANLLKIQVTYGYQMRLPFLDMEIPGVNWAMRNVMIRNDPDNWMYYIRGMFPLKSTATVRMQSESWDWQEPPLAVRAFDAVFDWIQDQVAGDDDDTDVNGLIGDGAGDTDGEDGEPTGGGAGDGEDATDPLVDEGADLECDGTDAAEGTTEEDDAANQALEDDRGFFGDVWDSVKNSLGAAYDFVRGFWAGMKNQVGDIANMVLHPVQTAKDLLELGKAFIDNPTETLAAIGDAIGKDLSDLVNCGAYTRGRIIGENVSPVFMLKFASKLAKFDGDAVKAAKAAKREINHVECASFVAGTMVWTPDGFLPIESIDTGQIVHSRNQETYRDKPQPVSSTFRRVAMSFYQLTTEQDQISLTAEHPLWVQGRGWVKVEGVVNGDILATADGDTLVLGIARVNQPVGVYNFAVENTPNYFVGSERLWVHNAACRLPWVQNIADLPDVNLVPINRAELFGSKKNNKSIRQNLSDAYPELENYKTGTDAAWQGHHIIPNNMSHDLLDELGFDKNSIHNGIPLPKDRSADSTPHSGKHVQAYDQAIKDFLDELEDMNIPDDPITQGIIKDALVDGIEDLRQAFAKREVELNVDPRIQQGDFDAILAGALAKAKERLAE